MDPKTRAILIEMNRPRHLHPQKTYVKGGHQEKIKPKFKTQLLQKSRKVFKKKVHKKLDLKEKWRSFKDSIPKKKCTMKCCKSFFYELFPFINIMQNYSMRKYLLADLIAGLTVGIIHIPQGMAYGLYTGMAYGLLANLPPVYGLYTSFFPVFIYFFFGSSKHVSIGKVTSLPSNKLIHYIAMNKNTYILKT
ncbi:hypothetical protein KUTeg_021219 [Tegillarca granosa]|uniref:SLC26A/SulP transporter domain-containing protein n=1 Tax=Tegillarca granosa TaxID=220873 RepID=A0ABQ9EF93_TEGGR|nr:hypothetical protein KUTeg_021219 [Tegillarca granosa]